MLNKRNLIIIIVIGIMLSSVSVGAKDINLVIDGHSLNSELKIINGRSLVAIGIIKDYFGDHIEWDQGSKSADIINNNSRINLKAGRRVALINSKPIPLSAKARLIDDRLFIPVRLLTKIYGGRLIWNKANKTIYYYRNNVNKISVNSTADEVQLIIDNNFLPKYDLNLYYNPKRLVLDLHNINLEEAKKLIKPNDSIVKRIRISQFKFDPAIVRVVVDINKMGSYQIKEDNSKLILNIKEKPEVVASSISSSRYPAIRDRLRVGKKKIVIDPGHGGFDPGAIGVTGVYESDVNYKIAQKTVSLLKKEGMQALMSRKKSQFVSLAQRAELSNGLDADLFISIHANSNPKSWINGTATYAHWKASKENWALAWYVQSEIIKRIGLKNNGLKAANFAVLRRTTMPSLLVETAFLSNPKEEKLLKDNKFQWQVAQGIVAGVKKYFSNKN